MARLPTINLAHCSLAKRALAPCKHIVGQASRHPPRLVAGLYTLSRDLTSSAHIRVLTFCGSQKPQQPGRDLVIIVTIKPAITVREKLLT